MQENDFEKQVQQKMEELQFVPSEPVWQKVEAQIRRKKERRRAIFLLLPLLLLGGGLVWYFADLEGEKTLPKVTSVQQEQKESKQNNEDSDDTLSNPNVLEQEKDEKINSANTITPTIKTNNLKEQTGQKENRTFLKKDHNISNDKEVIPVKPLIGKRGSNISRTDTHSLVLQNEIVQRERVSAEEKKTSDKNVSKPFPDSVTKTQAAVPIVQAEKTAAPTATSTDSIFNSTTTAAIDKTDSAEKIVAPVTPVMAAKQKKPKNWEWTVTGRIGVSGARSQMLDVFTVESAADFYASPSTGNTSSPAFSSSSTITNSTAFSIGAGVRKKIFQNAFVSTGLQYSQYRNKSMVGTRKAVDTTVMYNGRNNALESYFDQSGSQSSYTTRFHYIEIPLAFEYRLFKKIPLQLQHGVSAGYLFATNALYYDRSARIFYRNDEWLRKVSFNVFTTLDYRLWQAKKFSLYTGPQLQWGLTPLQQKREDKKHHQFFAGLQTRFTF